MELYTCTTIKASTTLSIPTSEILVGHRRLSDESSRPMNDAVNWKLEAAWDPLKFGGLIKALVPLSRPPKRALTYPLHPSY
ncbi:unnamed protein product [Ilex paraguariensis]|uniref:Uncharacterized protein n=1 Tax=Ilex paraguariensis TaxID=185542 RepID=A0ABC8RYW6_9AQUA